MSLILTILFYVGVPAISAYFALTFANKFSDWRIGFLGGTLVGIVVSFAVSFGFWENTDICAQCALGNN